MDALEIGIVTSSVLFHYAVFRLFKGNTLDDQKLKSCYLSHIHCTMAQILLVHMPYLLSQACLVEKTDLYMQVILASCLAYWITMPVDIYSPHFMVVGPGRDMDIMWMRYTVCYSIGYFTNDFVLLLLYPGIGGWDMILHHIVIGCFFTSGLIDRCCTPYHFLFMIEELSTPFLNLRWQYRQDKNSTTYIVSQALFVILFFASRIVVGTGFVWATGVYALPSYIARQATLSKKVHLYLQLLACTLSMHGGSRGLNLWWLWKIVKIVVRGGGKKYIDENKMD